LSYLVNLSISECFSCNNISLWIHSTLVHPQISHEFEPNEDLSEDIKLDFLEAAKIVQLSPRGAAALLRLCVQKMCVQLGEKGKHINTDIAALVKKGLSVQVQQALDIVRVTGNDAVHPGQIDLRDDRATASQLFNLVNIIAEIMISQPKRIQEMYDQLPEDKLEGIEQRDKPKP